ncbi:MAG: hypothetical protein HHJ15_13540 [Rhodoferax sp.]|uniref:hypothetical protein n=1 Tax=Rhodoferax sp. TaxID=50421 RepID=UPI0017BF5DCF|nr:hypothetical protein [Rhodoferax sp.]NMM20954.1 hypothetical protein [Rhodoferax sp.]
MPTLPASQLPKPTDSAEFEVIVRDAAKGRFKTDTFQLNGRRGQGQDGVDVLGKDERHGVIGIQCKLYKGALNFKTVEQEVRAADAFKPVLGRLYVATTSPNDAPLVQEVLELSEVRQKAGLFTVHLLFWDEITADLALTPELLYLHYSYLKPQGGSPTHDTSLFREFKEAFPVPLAQLIKDQDFGAWFSAERIQPLFSFQSDWAPPYREFRDRQLQNAFSDLFDAARAFAWNIAQSTWLDNGAQTMRRVDNTTAGDTLNNEATALFAKYETFIRLGRQLSEV